MPDRLSLPLVALSLAGVALYAFAVVRYLALYRERRSRLLLGFTIAFVLLAEAMIAVGLARAWQATWWEWHVLMLLAFGVIAVMAHREGSEERFGRLYLDRDARPVTVLFADLQGFTSFSERHEPGAVSAMLDSQFQVAIPAIERHGGTVDRLIGDAVFATFEGEDHAQCAARAALALQGETGALAAEHPDWPRFRAGLHTGPVARRRLRHRQRPHLQRGRRHGQPRLPDRRPGARRRRRDQRRDGEPAPRRRDEAARRRPGEGARRAGRGVAAAVAPAGLATPPHVSSRHVGARTHRVRNGHVGARTRRVREGHVRDVTDIRAARARPDASHAAASRNSSTFTDAAD